MESQSHNKPSSDGSSGQGKSAQAGETAGKTFGAQQATPTGQGAPSTDNKGQERVSGLDAVSSRQPSDQTRGQMGQLPSQTGAAGKSSAAPSSQNTPTRQSTSQESADGTSSATSDTASGASGSADRRQKPEWQKSLQSSLQQGWSSLSERVKTASPTQIALGAAAVGAAVWLGTRKRTPKAAKNKQQQSADRWLDYPTTTAGSRSEGRYGQYGRETTPAHSQYSTQQSAGQTRDTSTGSDSQTTKGAATGVHGQGNETWQRPADERWDD